MWQRVFGRKRETASPVMLVESLHAAGFPVVPAFKGDDLGWTEASLSFGTGSPILLSRYLTAEDDLRDDLNAYAAELESLSFQPEAAPLMERVIQTQQLITLRKPVDDADESRLDDCCDMICRWLACEADGIWQADQRGWFTAEGAMLIQEY